MRLALLLFLSYVMAGVITLPANGQSISFRDITAQAGIHFTHNNAAFGKKYLP